MNSLLTEFGFPRALENWSNNAVDAINFDVVPDQLTVECPG